MAYECQDCYSKIEDGEIAENSLGDLQCPKCGSFEIESLDDNDMLEEDYMNEEESTQDDFGSEFSFDSKDV
jgi:Zn finger protein HypA/HybF involved in hydrogenase expression